jgi:hypothetical protein
MWCEHERMCFKCDMHSCAKCRLVRGDGEMVDALLHELVEERGAGGARDEATTAARAESSGAPDGGGGGARAGGAGAPKGCGVHALCVDFDRTLASTKSGGSPLVGKHTADADLLALLCSPPEGVARVAVVTRNSNIRDIETFLRGLGVPESVRVLHASKRVGKGEVMLENGLLPPEPAAAPAATPADAAVRSGAGSAYGSAVPAASAASRSPRPGGEPRRDADSATAVTVFVDDSLAEHLTDPLLSTNARVLRILFSRGPPTES